MSDVDTNKWDIDDHGNLMASGLVEWGVASASGQVVLRVGYVRSQREHEVYKVTDRAPHQIQVSLSVPAAKELSMQLSNYAESVDVKPTTENLPDGP